jgi:mannose-1-phosphate guanylyltransferase
MKALYLSGASKTTLYQLTGIIPNAMIPIMNRPLLERSIAGLRHWEIDEILINITADSKAVREYFGDGSRCGIKINYNFEEACDIGRVLKKAGELFDEPFFVFNDDILWNMDLNTLIQTHRSKSAGLTVAVVQAENPCTAELIEADKNGYAVLPCGNRSADTRKAGMTSMGIYVVDPSVISKIPEDIKSSQMLEILPALIDNGVKVAVCQGCSYWMNMDTPEEYLQVHEDIFTGNYQISGVHFNDRSVFKDGKSIIDSTAVITGPVYIGDNVRIGAYATIGPNAVIGDNVCVHMGGKVVDSVLLNNVDVGICAQLKDSIAASDCKVKRKAVHIDAALTKNGSDGWRKIGSRRADRLGA